MSQDFYGKNKWVKTRKHHHCWGCGGSIPPGERAHYQSGVYEGDFGDFYMHEECWQDWKDNCSGEEIGMETLTLVKLCGIGSTCTSNLKRNMQHERVNH